ncbi:MAG: DUF11 domain-containing protein [Chloroflexota bacterium]
MLNTTDPETGYEADEYRLVQGLVWYSLNDDHSVLRKNTVFNTTTQSLTGQVGVRWRNYVNGQASEHNLRITNLTSVPEYYIQPGQPVTFTLKADVVNSGNFKISTPITATFWDGDPDAGGVQIGDPQVITETLSGCGYQLHNVQVDWPNRTAYSNTWYIKVESAETETNITDNKDSHTAYIYSTVPQSDLAISKTVNNSTPAEYSEIHYTVTLVNNGPDKSFGITATDILPVGISYNTAYATHGSYTGEGIWTVGDLDIGETALLTITADIDAGQSGNTITNTVMVTNTSSVDPQSLNNTASVGLTVGPPPQVDLEIVKTVDNPTPIEGETIKYTITVTNNGAAAAPQSYLYDILPTGLTLQDSEVTTGSYIVNTGHWTIGSLAVNDSETLVLTATVNNGQAGNTIVNSVTITGTKSFDPDSTNNTSAVTITVYSLATVDLEIQKQVNDLTPMENDLITYTLVVTNHGADVANNVVVQDTLPAGLTFQSQQASVNSYSDQDGSWVIGGLGVNSQASLTITAKVDVGQGGNSIINTASVTDTAGVDSNPNNDTAFASLTVALPLADLSISKKVDVVTQTETNTVTYVISVTNSGPEEATNVIVQDILPTGLTLQNSIASHGSYATDGAWAVGNLTLHESAMLTISAKVNVGQRGNIITNTASISSSDNIDNNSFNDSDQAVFTVLAGPVPNADVALMRTTDTTTPAEGSTVQFIITVTNYGPGSALSLNSNDLLPTGLTLEAIAMSTGMYAAPRWVINTLNISETARLTMTARIGAGLAGQTISHTLRINTDGSFDGDDSNNSDQIVLTIRQTSTLPGDIFLPIIIRSVDPNVGIE